MWQDYLVAFAIIYGPVHVETPFVWRYYMLQPCVSDWATAGELVDNGGWWDSVGLRSRVEEVKDFPHFSDHLMWGETEEEIRIKIKCNEDFQERLEFIQACLPWRELGGAIVQNRKLNEALWALRYAKRDAGRYTRRYRLNELRKIMGEEAYYSGMPIPPVPLWLIEQGK